MIKAIIFDCFGVLTADLWKDFVAALPDDQKEPARELNRALDASFISMGTFLEQISSLTGRKPELVEGVMINAETTKNTTLLEYVSELKKKYKIGLLSNISSDWVQREFLTTGELALFDAILLSYQIKVVKPDYRAFELAAERLGVDTNQAVMIDDSVQNVEAAKATGMQAILYSDFNQLKQDLNKLL